MPDDQQIPGFDERAARAAVAGRRAGEECWAFLLAEAAEAETLHGPAARAAFMLAVFCEFENLPEVQAIRAKTLPPARTKAEMPAWENAVVFCDEILTDCEGVPDEGQIFAQSVAQKVGDIRGTILRSKRLTLAQEEALQNMHRGILRWTGPT